MSDQPAFADMMNRLIAPGERTAGAKTVEAYGWLIYLEGSIFLLLPHWGASLLGLPDPIGSTLAYFRLVGMLIGGIGMLYIMSGRLNAQGFVFASMLDRPLVPFVMFGLWYWGGLPGVLAIAFSIEDFGSALWTMRAWRTGRLF